ncbi:MAG: pyruvate kinase [Flavobacteriales bacterium]|jgi:pyruvate kinase|nr:pyruvate kinase [Flavobacteriales bacterium]
MDRKTKIIATIGPASSSLEVLRRLILQGVNIARINFSHGTEQDNIQAIKNVRKINAELSVHTSILADLQGPKIRIGAMPEEGVDLKNGAKFTLDTTVVEGNVKTAKISYLNLPKDVKPGERILLDDGKIILEVTDTNKSTQVTTKVIAGGVLYSRKGVNLPNTVISTPSLTEKDRHDLKVAVENKVDWIGLSFVRSAKDVVELKEEIELLNGGAKVIAKIEKPEAVNSLNEILEVTDAVMVARGDLGVEIPLESVPIIQKEIVKKALKLAKPVIIATQMMESMINSITPTRAEVNDVANAVMDGADAVMLSGETSVGDNPVEVIEIMARIINEVETNYSNLFNQEVVPTENHARFITDSVCFNACRLAKRVQAKAIITMTHSGYTAFKISSQRPKSSIFVFSSNRNLLSCLSLVWGVKTYYYNKMVSTDNTIADIKIFLRKNGLVSKGDLIINTASMPIEEAGKTNMLKLSEID